MDQVKSIWEKIKTILAEFFAIVAAVLAVAFFLEKKKNDSLEAVDQNNKVKDKINQMDQQITQNNTQLAVEDQKRKDNQKTIDQIEKEKPSEQDILDTFNDHSN